MPQGPDIIYKLWDIQPYFWKDTSYIHNAQTAFLTMFQQKYFDHNERIILADLDEFIINYKGGTILELLNTRDSDVILARNHWAEITDNIITYTLKDLGPHSRTKCIYKGSYNKRLGIHWPLTTKPQDSNDLRMLHIVNVLHPERVEDIVEPLETFIIDMPANISNTQIVTPELHSGLGNQIFKILAGLGYCEKYNKNLVISKSHIIKQSTAHANNSHMLSRIFPNIPWIESVKDTIVIREKQQFNYTQLEESNTNIVLSGYFQNELYFPSDKLIPNIRTSYYPDTYFIHIRAGDYLISKPHIVDLRSYYQECFNRLPASTKYIVFSNDNIYAKEYLKHYNIEYIISDITDPLETLIEMSNCAGAICANSSFSWLGAFFQDKRNGIRFMPSIWLNNMNCDGVYPKWATIVNTKHTIKYKVYDIVPPNKYNIQVVYSIGIRCYTEMMLKELHLTKFSSIFGSLNIKSHDNIIKCLNTKFDILFNEDNLIYTKDIDSFKSLNKKSGFRTLNKVMDNVNDYHDATIAHHDLSTETAKRHFERGIQRLNIISKQNIPILFIDMSASWDFKNNYHNQELIDSILRYGFTNMMLFSFYEDNSIAENKLIYSDKYHHVYTVPSKDKINRVKDILYSNFNLDNLLTIEYFDKFTI